MKFYNKNGNEIKKEEFIKMYSDSYFIGNDRVVPRVNQNSRYAEEQIEDILENGIKTPIDIVHILAWKIGKLKHSECDSKNKFVYSKDWKNAEDMEARLYKKDFEIKKFCDFVMKHLSYMEQCISDKKPQDVLNKLKEGSVSGVGPVYMITMLYFISKKKYPIYDRFAFKAVEAIVNETKPGTTIKEKELPDKNSKKFKTIMENDMKDYIDNLKKVFGDEFNDRDVDRALWVYGHMF